MKHPVLVRISAVCLAIVYLPMLGAGIMGLQNAENDYNNNVSAVNKMQADLDEYTKLLAENEWMEPYASASEALTELKEKHEDSAAEHRTELATYTATKGGIQTGVEALDEADAALAYAKGKLENTKKELENTLAQLKDLQTACTTYSTLKPQLQALQGAGFVMSNLAGLNPMLSSSGGSSSGSNAEDGEQTGDSDISDKDGAFAAAYGNAIGAGESAIQVLESLGEMVPAELKTALADAVGALKTADTSSAEIYNNKVPVLIGIGTQVGSILSMSISQIQPVVDQLEPIVTNENVPSAEELAKNIQELEAGLVELDAGRISLEEAENALYYQRTLIWYEMGQLEDQKAELESTRDELLQEEQEIISKEQLSEEQKAREKRLKTLYLTFLEKPEVEEAVENGEDFVTAVEAYIAGFNEQIHEENTYRGYACILMIVAALPCLICFLASFEIIKKTGFVRPTALMLLLCAVAALGLLNYTGLGVSYSAAAVMIFALIQILVSGRKKQIKT